jgi:hypothetical protein
LTPKTPLTELELSAPIRTVNEANNREHWAVKNNRKKAQQAEIDIELIKALKGNIIQFPCTVHLTRVGPRKMDDDGLSRSFKGIRDQIAFRLGIDDGDSRIKFKYHQRVIGKRQYAVEIKIKSKS